MYWRVAGRDASRCVANQSFDPGTPLFLSLWGLLIVDVTCDGTELLTSVDQPLDKLEDLSPREMSVPVSALSPSRAC